MLPNIIEVTKQINTFSISFGALLSNITIISQSNYKSEKFSHNFVICVKQRCQIHVTEIIQSCIQYELREQKMINTAIEFYPLHTDITLSLFFIPRRNFYFYEATLPKYEIHFKKLNFIIKSGNSAKICFSWPLMYVSINKIITISFLQCCQISQFRFQTLNTRRFFAFYDKNHAILFKNWRIS